MNDLKMYWAVGFRWHGMAWIEIGSIDCNLTLNNILVVTTELYATVVFIVLSVSVAGDRCVVDVTPFLSLELA